MYGHVTVYFMLGTDQCTRRLHFLAKYDCEKKRRQGPNVHPGSGIKFRSQEMFLFKVIHVHLVTFVNEFVTSIKDNNKKVQLVLLPSLQFLVACPVRVPFLNKLGTLYQYQIIQ